MRKVNQFLRYSAAVAGAILLLSGTASARDLTVVGWGGALQEQLRLNFFDPYSKEIGKPVLEDSWDGGIGLLRTKTANGDGGWDVVQVESEELELGCQEGLFLKLDVAAIANPMISFPAMSTNAASGRDPTISFWASTRRTAMQHPAAGPISSICRNSPANVLCARGRKAIWKSR